MTRPGAPFLALVAASLCVAAAPAAAQPASSQTQPRPQAGVVGPTQGSIVGPTLRSTDLARSTRFYTEGLGMTLAGELELPNVSKLMFAFGAERRPPVIMLAQRKGQAGSAPLVHGDAHGATVLNVTDAEAVARRLTAAGYAPGALNVNQRTGFKGFMVKDPDGHEIEVTQRPAAAGAPAR